MGNVISRDGRHPVIGVVGDFHFASLHEPVGPLVITRQPWGGFNVLTARLNTTDTEPVLQKMEKIWQQIVPNETFSYEFLDRFIQGAYEPEKRFGRLFLWFSLLAVFMAGLGLLGLAAYSTAQRRHKIAICKVLGAEEKVILRKLVTDFLKCILAACERYPHSYQLWLCRKNSH